MTSFAVPIVRRRIGEAPVTQPSVPCLATPDGKHCMAGLLTGAACCAHGDCVLCEEQLRRMRISGFPEQAVARSWLHTRTARLRICSICGFPPPPPMDAIPPLPHLPRLGRTHSGSWNCRTCGRALPRRRRHYCSHACWREHVRGEEMEGNDIRAPERTATYRMRMR